MLYLVQHGIAMDKEENPDRPLTDRGREEVRAVANAARRMEIDVDRIVHSGKLRARQTAEIFGETFRSDVEEQAFLKATEDPKKAADYLAGTDEAMMLVGHKPHLPKLTSYLVLGDPERQVVDFQNGGIVALEAKDEMWRISWILTPEMTNRFQS